MREGVKEGGREGVSAGGSGTIGSILQGVTLEGVLGVGASDSGGKEEEGGREEEGGGEATEIGGKCAEGGSYSHGDLATGSKRAMLKAKEPC